MLSDEQIRQDTLAVLGSEILRQREYLRRPEFVAAQFDEMTGIESCFRAVSKADPLPCPDCDGSGSVPQHSSSTYMVRCETCRGKGTL